MKTFTTILIILTSQLAWADVPKLMELVLPDPFSTEDGPEAIRPYEELLGTGIGKYKYSHFEGSPIRELTYYLVDASMGNGAVDPGEAAANYIEAILEYKKESEDSSDKPPVLVKINGLDCLISDYPNQDQGEGYWLKEYAIHFYVPEHQRVYAISFRAFWNEDAKYKYNHQYTPMKIKKAAHDFIAYNR